MVELGGRFVAYNPERVVEWEINNCGCGTIFAGRITLMDKKGKYSVNDRLIVLNISQNVVRVYVDLCKLNNFIFILEVHRIRFFEVRPDRIWAGLKQSQVRPDRTGSGLDRFKSGRIRTGSG